MPKYTKGKIVEGVVTGIESYGIFVSLDEFYSGLIHISEISNGFVKNIHDYVNIGDTIYVEIIGVNEEESHLNLSIKNINYRKKHLKKRQKIVETTLGFKTLAYKLPIWIDESFKKIEKKQKSSWQNYHLNGIVKYVQGFWAISSVG